MNKVNRVVVLHIISSLGCGGAESALFKLVSNDKVHTHVVVSLTDSGYYGSLLADCGVTYYILVLHVIEYLGLEVFITFSLVLNILDKWDIQIVHSWLYHADFFATFIYLFKPYLIYIWGIRHSTLSIRHSKPLTLLLFFFNAFTSRLVANSLLSCSYVALNCTTDLVTKIFLKCNPNGVDISSAPNDSLNVFP